MRALKFKFIRIGGGGMREEGKRGGKGEKDYGAADSASPATRARQHSPGSRSPPFAIPPLFHYSGMDVGIKAVDERSKNFNSIKEEPKKRCLLLSPLSLSLPFLSSSHACYTSGQKRERYKPPLPLLSSWKIASTRFHPRDTPHPVLHLIISLLSSNYRNKIIISRRFPPLPSPCYLLLPSSITSRKRGFARISGCRGMS